MQEQDRDSISAAPADCLLRLFVGFLVVSLQFFGVTFPFLTGSTRFPYGRPRFGRKIPNLADQFREMWGFLRDFRGPPFAQ